MLSAVLESTGWFFLAGLALYFVRVSPRLKNERRWQGILTGLILGVLTFLFEVMSHIMSHAEVMHLLASGPLMFAGFLGGPIGGAIATIFGALSILPIGEITDLWHIVGAIGFVSTGIFVAFVLPPDNWPHVSPVHVLAMFFGALFVLFMPGFLGGAFDTGLHSTSAILEYCYTVLGLGVISTVLMWQINNFANDQARAARRVRELSDRLVSAQQLAGLGTSKWIIGEGTIAFDDGMTDLCGLARSTGQIPLSEMMDLLHPDDLGLVMHAMDKAADPEVGKGFTDFRIVRPSDGQVRHLRSHWQSRRDAETGQTLVTAIHMDLTQIREAEQRQLEAHKSLSQLASNLPGAIVQTYMNADWNAELLYISPRCEEIWGYSDAEFHADNELIFRAHDPLDVPEFYSKLEAGFDTGAPIRHRFKIRHRDGSLRWVDFFGDTLVSGGRRLLNAIVLDVTSEVVALQHADEQRDITHRAQKLESVGKLTGGVAHDFNNLLAIIIGSLEVMRDEADPALRNQRINEAMQAALRGGDLTKNLLAFARQARLEPEVMDLNQLVGDAKNWIARTLPETIRVETSLLDGLWPVCIDRGSLQTALLNLIVNARDAMDGRGHLTVETANIRMDEDYIAARQEVIPPGRYVMLAVTDTGTGISEEVRRHIFEPFYTSKPPGEGTGLGLSMVMGFMQQSGGTVQVYSELGEGTTFKLYFPVAEGAVAAASETREDAIPVEPAPPGTRILVVEDDPAVADTLVRTLERAGLSVISSKSGDEALKVFRSIKGLDVVLTDIVMPGTLQGADLASAIRQEQPDFPIVFLSGYADEAKVHGKGLTSQDIRLMKPVRRADLLEAIGKAISLNAL
ncbi:response regulator [Aliishimia ponticola]|uniref:histidine kinase n=1 Tax=Aliishimia ponticola TaxID=2499833 RepID=A0A4S4NHR5_9RHOB|nr:ATP-binding protein [Aliishimia ponticola]THH35640.1 response regulator [Aliishimia ponticola]